ncbi:hypothetical protein [uncultured Nitratireductor sp.]|uniref:hypothetical protein n=1 Tax=uncultured Nitratireductor sp. TaxID=520953 RepID=UPI0025E9F740|nr:hypothetical protein [uncultured Nitratireductor sp.]
MSEDLIERLRGVEAALRIRECPLLASDAAEARGEIERLRSLTERLRMEAQGHSGEARTANASLQEAYQVASGRTGEPGNWNGAEPIKSEIERLRARLAEASRMLARVPGALNSFFSAGIEERENGSARRQEKLMVGGEMLVSEICHFLIAFPRKGEGE